MVVVFIVVASFEEVAVNVAKVNQFDVRGHRSEIERCNFNGSDERGSLGVRYLPVQQIYKESREG